MNPATQTNTDRDGSDRPDSLLADTSMRSAVLRILSLMWALVGGAAALADLAPEQLVLLTNANVPQGLELARFYADARQIPRQNILQLDLPEGEEITFAAYQERVVPVVRQFLRERRAATPARCLVTFYGVPLRIAARPEDWGEAKELTSLKAEATAAIERLQARATRPASLPASRPALSAEEARHIDELMLRTDRESRAALRDLVRQRFDEGQYIAVLRGQIASLSPGNTVASFDSELALLWWGLYPRANWVNNPLHYRNPRPPGPIVMTARLDAPTPQLVRQMIEATLRAEQDGLAGRMLLDSRGIKLDAPDPTQRAYATFDQTLRELAGLVQRHTKLPLLLDEQPGVLQPGLVDDAALYCGWYSLRNYVAPGRFKPGAVGYHVASFELVSLHGRGEKGWVAGLLKDGVVATMGPVAEPFLAAFPAADDFFPLLLTGKLTLAEVYWRTVPMASWMMVLIGDPLYRPLARNPALAIEDLPARLRAALTPATLPATAPMTRPTPDER